MLICQPPVTEMRILTDCCDSLYDNRDPEPETRKVINAKGITVGDLLSAIALVEEEHKLCPYALVDQHDRTTGSVDAEVRFEGVVDVKSRTAGFQETREDDVRNEVTGNDEIDEDDENDGSYSSIQSEESEHFGDEDLPSDISASRKVLEKYVDYKREGESETMQCIPMPWLTVHESR